MDDAVDAGRGGLRESSEQSNLTVSCAIESCGYNQSTPGKIREASWKTLRKIPPFPVEAASREEAIEVAMQRFDKEGLGIDRGSFEFNHATFEPYEKNDRGHSRLVATLGDDDRLCGTVVPLAGDGF